jgi:hypothetical protein
MENLDELLNDVFLEQPTPGIIRHKAKTYSFKLFKRVFEFKTYIEHPVKSILSCDEIVCSDEAINLRIGLMPKDEYDAIVEKSKAYEKRAKKHDEKLIEFWKNITS